MNKTHLKLCLVTKIPTTSFSKYQQFIESAIQGGVTCVQLRMKDCSKSEIMSCAIALKKILTTYQTPLLINDHIDIAKKINADGVHLGQSDATIESARADLGHNKWIGLSIETLQELEIANQSNDINYIAASSIFPTQNKSDCKTIWGIEGLKKIMQQSAHPVVAIGGINIDNISDVFETGISGVAVIGAIHDHHNAYLAARALNQKIILRENICSKK